MPSKVLPLLLLAATAAAQEITLPEHAYFRQSSASTILWRSTAMHFQAVYDTTHFIDQGCNGQIVITRLRFRAADGLVDAGGQTYSNVTVRLSSCPLNYASISTTFANNRGADNLVCYTGPVTTLPAAGTTPNSAYIDINLSIPFFYDPTLGSDLVIEVDSAAPSSAVVGCAASSLRTRRISATSQTAATGTSSTSSPAILVSFAGPGGYPVWAPASSVAVGNGCYQQSTSYYEDFQDMALFDLSNSTITMVPNNQGGYTVIHGPATPFHPHGPTHLGQTDDDMSVVNLPPGFGAGFPFPGGSTSVISICSNGYVFLANDLFADFPDPLFLLAWLSGRLAPFWCDLVPDPTNNVYYDIDPSGTTVYVTWDALPTFSVGGVANVQLVMNANGTVEYRYGTCTGVALDLGLVGWSRGNAASDPGSIDISANPVFNTTGPDLTPLGVDSTPPYIGTQLSTTVFNIPAAALATVNLISPTSFPGIDLGSIGAAGCNLYIDPTNTLDFQISALTPEAVFLATVPNNLALLGVVVYGQAASLYPPANTFGMITSNQIVLTVGNS